MKKILSFVFVLALFGSNIITPVRAHEGVDPDNDGIPGVLGVDYDIVSWEEEPKFVIPEEELSQRLGFGVSIRNMRKNLDCIYGIVDRVSGVPGLTIGMGKTISLQNSVSLSSGVSLEDLTSSIKVNLGINTTVSRTYSTQTSASLAIPHTHNGKKVVRAEITAQPIFYAFNYDVYRFGIKSSSNYVESFKSFHYSIIYYYG